jgi:23S rRNA (adenine2030-N6)-methyltransferase
MNYQHGFHAGGFSDVLKHATLVNLISTLSAKDKPYLLIDTHGGRGGYDFLGQGAVTMEWKEGIGRLLPIRKLPTSIHEYVRLVRAYDKKFGNFDIKPAENVRHYPGSPRIARAMLRPGDRLVVAELNPSEAIFLRREFAGDKSIEVREEDGYGLLKSMLPPPERRALVLIDPSYESRNETADAVAAIGHGLRRFATGVFALWYPIKDMKFVDALHEAVIALDPPETIAVHVQMTRVGVLPRTLLGSGMIVINPPWKFADTMRELAPWMAVNIGNNNTATAEVKTLVPEKGAQPSEG